MFGPAGRFMATKKQKGRGTRNLGPPPHGAQAGTAGSSTAAVPRMIVVTIVPV
jgi:hypothetical protein